MTTNLVEIRKLRRLTTNALSERLSMAGQPIHANGITRIEKGGRRVDTDDLVALALALGTTPNRLLLPNTAPESQTPPGEPISADVELTPTIRTTAQAAWRWASGEAPLPEQMPWEKQPTAYLDFQRENRPHDSAPLTFDQMMELRARLEGLWKVTKATGVAEGIPIKTIANFMLLMADWSRYEDQTGEGS
jgi:transcriptional regulator with XRE-family HTH domain